jgi:sirohydrochlorin ferrochelatase
MTTALLLIAHGSRRGEANADLQHAAEALRRRGPYPLVECCYLELAEPNIAVGGRRCVELGASRVLMLPFFLSAGVHVTEDLKEARQQLAAEFPEVDFRLAQPIGRHPLIVEILAERAKEANSEPASGVA